MTSHELEARIRKIEDIEDIKNLEAKYLFLVDTRQLDKAVELFVDDLTVDFDHFGTFKTKVEYLEFLNGSAEGLSMMCHQEMNPYIELDGDRATGTWYLFGLFTHVLPEGEVAAWIQGRVDNQYVRVDGKWKVSVRMFRFNVHTPYEDGWVKTRLIQA